MVLLGFLKNHSSVSQVGVKWVHDDVKGGQVVHDDVIMRSSGVKWVLGRSSMYNRAKVNNSRCQVYRSRGVKCTHERSSMYNHAKVNNSRCQVYRSRGFRCN